LLTDAMRKVGVSEKKRVYSNGADFKPKPITLAVLMNGKVYPHTRQKMLDKRVLFL